MRRRIVLSAAVIHVIVDRVREVRGADFIHVRNKELDAIDLLKIVRWYVEQGHRAIVNTRTDVAIAGGAAGVHLPSHSLVPSTVRRITPPEFLIGISCHSREDLLHAQGEGADYAYLSPVFTPLSKADATPPLGIDGFRRAVEGLTIPVLALGGITPDRIQECLRAGAAGVAGITLTGKL